MRLTLGVLLLLGSSEVAAQPISLVKDIAPQQASPFGPGPRELAVVGGTLFFGGDDPANGRELWRSDGTPGGTRLVRDILPGPISSVPRWLTGVGGTLFFVAFDGEHGIGLWKSDGTAAGTVLVKGVGPDFSRPEQLVAVGGRLFLAAFDHAHGLELWRSDGTEAGTVRVKDILPGPGSSISSGYAPPSMADVAGALHFAADDGTAGPELWRSDGTALGTFRVRDIRAGGVGSAPSQLTSMGGASFFYADDGVMGRELWRSTGTAAGTQPLADACPGSCGYDPAPGTVAAAGATVFFMAGPGPSLWKTDGTAAGTVFVANVGSIYDPHFTAAGGLLYFVEGGGPAMLWRSDGTAPGTFPLAPVQLFDNRLVAVGTQLFLLSQANPSRDLWTSDGTPGGTVLVRSFEYSDRVLASQALGGALLFVADDGIAGSALWRSDGTAPGTTLIADPHPGLCPSPAGLEDAPCGSSSPEGATDVAGTLYFSTASQELWRSDGTNPGTLPLADLSADCSPGSPCDGPTDLTAVGSRLFFRLFRLGSTNGVWSSDGTPSGTAKLLDLVFFPFQQRGNLVDFNGTAYLQADAAPNGLWKSDGTPGGTVIVAPFDSPSSPFLVNPDQLTLAGGLLFMAGSKTAQGSELWKSDGTTAGTVLVKDIRPGPAGSGPAELTAVGSLLYFTADDGVAGRELWRSDGTPAGTVRVKDILPGPGSSFPHGLAASGGALFFTARDATTGYELWRSDGSGAGTIRVDVRPGSASSHPEDLAGFAGRLIFAANDGAFGREPWVSDGTPGGTHRLVDIAPGPASGGASDFVASGTDALFAAHEQDHGRELWRTDGVVAHWVQDVAAGANSSDPSELALSGPRVFLAAEDGAVGRELWALDATASGVDLGLTTTAAPDPVATGQPVTFTFTVSTTPPSPATGVTLTDTLPQGVVFINAVPGPPVCTHLAGVVTCNLGTVPPGPPTVVTIVAQATLPTGVLVNTGLVAGNEPDPILGNNTATSTTTVSPADLSVVLLDAPDPVAVGGAIGYTMVATNNGPATATGVAATLVLPPGLGFVSALPGPPICTNALSVVTCDFGSLASAASATAVITASVGPGVLAIADAAVSGTQVDPALANNVASAITTITGLTANELDHGSSGTSDLAAAAGPVADQDWYRIGQEPHSSYEVVVDAVSGDLGASGPALRRLAPDGATPLQNSILVGGRSSRSLAWENASSASQVDELVEVTSLGCTTGCTSSDAYRIRAWETTGRIPRFNNAGSQTTVMVLQNATDRAVNGTAWFWSGAGTLLASRAFGLSPRGLFVLNTAGLEELQGVSGSITVSSDAPYGGLGGKAVAIEPDTGFTFDSPLQARER